MPEFRVFRGRAPLLALAAALLSSACGGEGTGSPPVSSPTPPQPTGPGTPGINEIGRYSRPDIAWSGPMNSMSPGLPDADKWSYDIERNSAGWYNNELQYYGNARPENSNVEGGMLVITARREDLSTLGLPDWSGQRYSSARLITRDKASWTYGFIEVRAKLPCGVGTWPAIWTLSKPPQARLARRWRDRHHGTRGIRSGRGARHGAHRRLQPHARQPSQRHDHHVPMPARSFIATRCTGRRRASPWASTIATTSSTRTTAPAMPSGPSTARSS